MAGGPVGRVRPRLLYFELAPDGMLNPAEV